MIQQRADVGSDALLAERHDSVHALGFDGPDKSLGKGVQISSPRSQVQGLDTAVLQRVPDGGGVEGLSAKSEVFRAAEGAIIGVGQLPRDLHHPVLSVDS